VRRDTAPGDRRSIIVTLTPVGAEVLAGDIEDLLPVILRISATPSARTDRAASPSCSPWSAMSPPPAPAAAPTPDPGEFRRHRSPAGWAGGLGGLGGLPKWC